MLLVQELGKYELDPGEPMAFIDRKTRARIRDVRDMPRTEQQRDMSFVRSIMVRACGSQLLVPVLCVGENWGHRM